MRTGIGVSSAPLLKEHGWLVIRSIQRVMMVRGLTGVYGEAKELNSPAFEQTKRKDSEKSSLVTKPVV